MTEDKIKEAFQKMLDELIKKNAQDIQNLNDLLVAKLQRSMSDLAMRIIEALPKPPIEKADLES